MSRVDLHPEELLDKHEKGTLSGAERARLDAHLATCSVCRFELDTRADFAGLSLEPLGLPRTDRPSAPPEIPFAPELAAVPVRARRKRRAGWVLGLAAALIGGMGFAAISSGLVPASWKPATRVAERTVRAASNPASEIVTSAPVPVPVSAAEESPTPAPVDPANPRGKRESGVHAPVASELFRAANAARRVNDQERAIALYRELETRFPHSEEARVSYATLGSLLLDRGDPRSALEGFNHYLSRGDAALGEEALVGRALSLQKLGNRDGEVLAWQEVLRRFPASVHARVARARLGELGSSR